MCDSPSRALLEEEATVRFSKAHPESNSSAGSQAPVRPKTSGTHVSGEPIETGPVFIRRSDAEASCRTHTICYRHLTHAA
jgi:hypothetical protein